MNGKLIGVGVGPGDPLLLTIKAARLIRNAAVLAYAVDAEGESIARRIAAEYIHRDQTELPLFFSMSSDESERKEARREAARHVLAVLRRGVDVVYLCEGDPLIYSTFQHLADGMPADIDVEVCPGISAMGAAAAAARFPLVVEGQMLVVASASNARGRIPDWLREGYAVVLYKTGRRLPVIVREIEDAGVPCHTVLVQNVTMDGEVISIPIQEWHIHEAPYFSIVLLRPVDEDEGAV